MKYFCAQCQKAHAVSDIAADLREISRQDITNSISSIFQGSDGVNNLGLYSLSNNLQRFVNAGPLQLIFKKSDIPNYLINARREGQVLSGNFRLTLEWLLNCYRDSETQQDELDGSVPNLDPIIQAYGDRPVYDREIKFFFYTIDGEEVLNYMTAADNDPFTDENGVMLGYLRTCPHCGYHISRAVGRAEEIVVALAGSPRAGKTSCLTAIASSLISGRYRRYGFQMDAFEFDQAWDYMRKEIEWFDRGYAVTKTPVDQQAVPSYSFLVKYFDQKRVLTFVDMPGEFWQSGSGLTREFFIQYAGLYRNIDCVWFFISKLMAYDVDLGDGLQDWQRELMSFSAEDGSIIRMGSAANLSGNFGALKEFLNSYGIPVPPIAVILSKAEMELGQADLTLTEQYGLFPASNKDSVADENQRDIEKLMVVRGNTRALKESEYFRTSEQVREFFRFQNPGICNAVEQHCPRRSYISMAAYGHPAAERSESVVRFADTQPERVFEAVPATPYHEMMPLIWTLSIMGVINVEHPCVYRWRAGLFGRWETEKSEELLAFRYKSFLAKKQDEKLRRAEEDLAAKCRDIGCNLLMCREGKDGRLSYSVTTIEHKRE